ncbi:MAG: DegV family protein [Clostridia bacterium]|nr:DegV family protein [Clostridia bacterium]
MSEYVIVTDSGSDLSATLAASLGVTVVPLTLQIGEESKFDGDLEPKAFYDLLRAKTVITTSAVNMDRFMEAFRPHLAAGKDLLYIGFSSGLSATYTAGRNAVEELRAEFPDRKIYAVDSLCASLGQGLLVAHAAKKRDGGASIEDVYAFLEENKLHLAHWFTVDDLFFLKRGGRVSAATAVLGTMLAIKPLMHVDNEGHLIRVSTVRGRRASIDAIFDKIAASAIAPEGQLYYICHGDCLDDAEYLAGKIRAAYPGVEVMIDYTGTVIGSHSGPGTLALFFLATER